MAKAKKRTPKPEPERFVRVVDVNDEPVKRLRDGGKHDCIAVLVIDRNNKILHAVEWDVAVIDRELAKAKKRGASEVMIARDLMEIGDDAGKLANKEICARLVQREKERA